MPSIRTRIDRLEEELCPKRIVMVWPVRSWHQAEPGSITEADDRPHTRLAVPEEFRHDPEAGLSDRQRKYLADLGANAEVIVVRYEQRPSPAGRRLEAEYE